jgi:choice-of-anchor A domain-containing protein
MKKLNFIFLTILVFSFIFLLNVNAETTSALHKDYVYPKQEFTSLEDARKALADFKTSNNIDNSYDYEESIQVVNTTTKVNETVVIGLNPTTEEIDNVINTLKTKYANNDFTYIINVTKTEKETTETKTYPEKEFNTEKEANDEIDNLKNTGYDTIKMDVTTNETTTTNNFNTETFNTKEAAEARIQELAAANPNNTYLLNIEEVKTKTGTTVDIYTVKEIILPNTTDELKWVNGDETNLLGSASNWNGFVLGNIYSAVDFEGAIAVSGNLTSNVLSVNNGRVDKPNAGTDNIGLLVGGNIDVTGSGTVKGVTAVGKADGNTYSQMFNDLSTTTTKGTYIIKDSSTFFADAKKDLINTSGTLSNLTKTNDSVLNNGSYNLTGTNKLLVFNIDGNNFKDNIFNFTIDNNQAIIVNFTNTGDINFENVSFNINGHNADVYLREHGQQIIFNFKAANISLKSTSFYGIMLAPKSNVTFSGSNIAGKIIVNDFTGLNGSEFHLAINDINIGMPKDTYDYSYNLTGSYKTTAKSYKVSGTYSKTTKTEDNNVSLSYSYNKVTPKYLASAKATYILGEGDGEDEKTNIPYTGVIEKNNQEIIYSFICLSSFGLTTTLLLKRKELTK